MDALWNLYVDKYNVTHVSLEKQHSTSTTVKYVHQQSAK